jgi:hypothetical protein
MISCACLLDPKKTPMCWFGCSEMGVFVNRFTIYFSQFVNFEHIFSLCRFVRFGNGCCMEHVQGFEGSI